MECCLGLELVNDGDDIDVGWNALTLTMTLGAARHRRRETRIV